MTTFPDIDPADGTTIAEISLSTPAQLDDAIARARAAAPGWADTPPEDRAARLARGAEALAAREDELAALATREMGKTLDSARREIRTFVGGIPTVLGEVAQALEPAAHEARDTDTVVVREPHGVVAVITPWNFPVGMPLELLIPALATGNTVVFKPSEHTPLCGQEVAASLAAELPGGVLEVLHGAGEVGARLVAGEVDMVAFTGSRETGKAIMESAVKDLKRLVLELGGKDPMLVFADADLDRAADCAVDHSLRNTGQVCCSVERVYVAESVAAEFEQKVRERAERWRHGRGTDPDVKMGPLVSQEQRAKVVEQVDDAVAGGARLVLGGSTEQGPGFFYPATVLADVRADQRIAREETFGPVVCLSTFSGDEDEAVALANDTEYGLGANVWTGEAERGRRVAARIRAGQVGVNCYLGGAPGTPWVGARQSGFGFIGGVEGHRQFTVPKTISVAKEGA